MLNETTKQDKNLFLETFGCQMNVNDSEKIAGILKGLGYRTIENPEEADLVILNTCSVRARAERKVYGHLGRYKALKKRNGRLIIGVGGCVAQQEGERLLQNAPFVDIVFGTHNLHLLPEMVRAAESGEKRTEVSFIDNEQRLDLFPPAGETAGVTAFVTIMQGCDNFCSYCIVPYVRGREISRRPEEILEEIRRLSDQGVREITLLGQNVNSYGLKIAGYPNFPELIQKIADVSGIERVRFTTSHPKDLSSELVECFAQLPKLCSHMHLPAQSGSDAVLAAMRRGYTRDEYLVKVDALKKARPDIQITGDIIVGFPGESEDDFEQTLSLMQEVGYADLFSFIYSKRPETKAAEFQDSMTYEEKHARLARLHALQSDMALERNESFVGTLQGVLVEGRSRRGDQWYGRTSGNRIVTFAGEGSLVGEIVDVRIIRAHQTLLLGELNQG
ncbi:MAG: tRNA (N6-isopentenyl adenosine(37)-C2)-methylthiotransferase MiaB [Geobacter sp.]|nr:tRNA (N6-isopentenyl adenosine(37)-C2)-methylthiotransferase MiaB [Geobacter sp.]